MHDKRFRRFQPLTDADKDPMKTAIKPFRGAKDRKSAINTQSNQGKRSAKYTGKETPIDSAQQPHPF